jgi:hypothetical protein
MAEYYPDIHGFLTIGNDVEFRQICLDTFRYQYRQNKAYREYCSLLETSVEKVSGLSRYLFYRLKSSEPIKCNAEHLRLRKYSPVVEQADKPTSKHFVKELDVYDQILVRGFEMFYGPVSDYCILALLPSYLEREGSSLVYMAEKLMELSGNPEKGFYLYDHEKLAETIRKIITRTAESNFDRGKLCPA